MYRVLLVDDVKLELDVLKDYTDWHSMDLEVVGTAMNGQEALRCVEELLPDIVLTDVKIPFMDGITFARKAREKHPKLKIIFVSGYDEFDFAKQAVSVGAFAYLLKPVDDDELREVMEKVKASCLEEQVYISALQALEEKFLRNLLLEEDESSKTQLVSDFDKISKGQVQTQYILYYLSIDRFAFAEKDLKKHPQVVEAMVLELLTNLAKSWQPRGFVFNPYPGGFCCLKPVAGDLPMEDQIKQEVQEWLDRLSDNYNIKLTASSDGRPHDLFSLSDAFNIARLGTGKRFFHGHGRFFLVDASDRMPLGKDMHTRPFIENLTASVRKNNKLQTDSLLDEFFRLASELQLSEAVIKLNVYNILHSAIESLMTDSEADRFQPDENTFWKEIERRDTLESLHSYVSEVFNTILSYNAMSPATRHAFAIEKVIRIIRDSYNQPITIEELARKAYLSSSYLRSIFKKLTGETIFDMQMRIRMEKAEELLRDSSLRIKDISTMLGYEYASHFIALFIKYKGLTPAEYRSRLSEEGFTKGGDSSL